MKFCKSGKKSEKRFGKTVNFGASWEKVVNDFVNLPLLKPVRFEFLW